jgi:hypothetical protein
MPQLPPAWFGQSLPEAVRLELEFLLRNDSRRLGNAYLARVDHPELNLTQLHQHTEAANVGALSNLMAAIHAISDGTIPDKPSRARLVISNVRSLRKRAKEDPTRTYLDMLLLRLEEVAGDPEAADAETEELVAASSELEEAAATELHSASGVYVFTYPQYWRYPYREDSERRLLKIGQTGNNAWKRVIAQAKSTGMPEDPQLLRVYVSADAGKDEATFHRLLDAAEHERSKGKAAGTEWFATTTDFLDEIARTIGLKIIS